jgi:antitoxin component YwqK of YwqJK toxin-antitoxin module
MKKEYPKDGIHKEFYPNGQKQSEGHYRDGKKEGKQTHWYENGQKKEEGNVKVVGKYSLVHGKWNEWHENGQMKSEGNYKDGMMVGKWTHWYENGQKKAEGNVKDGKVDGKRTMWYENGNKKLRDYNQDGMEHGRQTSWDFNGYIIEEKIYRNGELIKTIEIDKPHKIKKFLNVADFDEEISRPFDTYLQDVCLEDSIRCERLLTRHAVCGFDTALIQMSIDGRYAGNSKAIWEVFDNFCREDDNDHEKDSSNTHIDEHTLVAFDRFLKQVSDTDPVYYKSLRSKYDKGVFNDRLEKLNGITDMADLFDEFGEF